MSEKSIQLIATQKHMVSPPNLLLSSIEKYSDGSNIPDFVLKFQ